MSNTEDMKHSNEMKNAIAPLTQYGSVLASTEIRGILKLTNQRSSFEQWGTSSPKKIINQFLSQDEETIREIYGDGLDAIADILSDEDLLKHDEVMKLNPDGRIEAYHGFNGL